MRRRDGTKPSPEELAALGQARLADIEAVEQVIKTGNRHQQEHDEWVSQLHRRVRQLIDKYSGVQPGERVLADIRKRMNAEDGAEWDDLEETLVASTTEWHRSKS